MLSRHDSRLLNGSLALVVLVSLASLATIDVHAQQGAIPVSADRQLPAPARGSFYSDIRLQRDPLQGCSDVQIGAAVLQQHREMLAELNRARPVPAITLDGSGRFVDLVATETQPAYWDESIPAIDFYNHPEEPGVAGVPDDLVLEAEAGTNRQTWAIPANGVVRVPRSEVMWVSAGGLAKVKVTRARLTIATLWFIMRKSSRILLNADGPIDPVFRSSVVPAYVPCGFELEYADDPAKPAPPPVVVEPKAKAGRDDQANPHRPQYQKEITSPVAVIWTELTDPEDDTRPKSEKDPEAKLVVLKGGRSVSVIWLTRTLPDRFVAVTPTSPRSSVATPAQLAAPPPPPAASGAATGSQAARASARKTEAAHRIRIDLDRTGVATQAFLNRRRPAYIPRFDGTTELVFVSQAGDRSYVVTFGGIPDSERAELVRAGARIGACRDNKCKAVVYVPPGGQATVSIDALRNAYVKGGAGSTVTFEVAFFDDDTTPANSRGYLTLVDAPYFTEPGSSTAWVGSTAVTLANDPDLSTTKSATEADPVGFVNRTHVGGSVTLGFAQTLSNRADFMAEITARSGDFGQDSGIKASKYIASIYTSHGVTLAGGRLDVAAPTDAIAFQESGDAVKISGPGGPGFWAAGYVFRRQLNAEGFTVQTVGDAIKKGASHLDRNNRDLVLQYRDVQTGRLRSGFYYVFGFADRGRLRTPPDPDPGDGDTPERELVSFDATSWSFGGETVLSVTPHSVLSVGLYHSERTSEAPADLRIDADDQQGSVGLVTYRYTNINHDKLNGDLQATDFSITGQFGVGGKYVGENQAFAPDSLFLSKFAGVLNGSTGPIGPGLTGKKYFGVLATTPVIPKLVSTLQLSHYRLNEAREGHTNLGTEMSVDFRLEQPKGVRYQFTVGGFQPGAALKPTDESKWLMKNGQFVARFTVTLRL